MLAEITGTPEDVLAAITAGRERRDLQKGGSQLSEESEVSENSAARVIEEDIGWFDVTVDLTVAVQVPNTHTLRDN